MRALQLNTAHAQETLQRLERSQTRLGSPRRASRTGLQEGSPSPKGRPRRLDIENIEQSPEPRAGTPPRPALGDVTPGHNAQARMSATQTHILSCLADTSQSAACQALETPHGQLHVHFWRSDHTSMLLARPASPKPAPWLTLWLRR